ncbi:hypothetical protein HJC23_006141 [Cyclotella cryptica]|uniref:Polysaccharide pyruvyl transferase domain-containing protein n=1 Tax=Cyclotella cryptica TaxID=29204 RepID=A0ABD3QJQ9_9STRA|eukprot:CCRYP_004631-RA/>CCRYP_004631-RA protein AED:0.02 eAED:0.02 QI:209/1/1/1/1/1/2/288/719
MSVLSHINRETNCAVHLWKKRHFQKNLLFASLVVLAFLLHLRFIQDKGQVVDKASKFCSDRCGGGDGDSLASSTPKDDANNSINVFEGAKEGGPFPGLQEGSSLVKEKSAFVPEGIKIKWLAPEPHLSPGCRVEFKDPNMSLCYFIPYGANFGDELGPAVVKRILEYLFGCSTYHVHAINLSKEKRDGRICLFTLGSIFHMTRKGDHVWGTGHNPTWQRGWGILRDKSSPRDELLTIVSVRGPKTSERLNELGLVKNASKIPNGDPGFLIPFLYSQYYHLPTRSLGVKPAFRKPDICFVPHAHDLDYNFIKQPPSGLRLLTVKQGWETMLDKLRMCDYIISSSLHGIIVGDALGIPTQWYQFPGGKTEQTEGMFKYQDYFKTIGRQASTPNSVFDMKHFLNSTTYMTPLPIQKRKEIAQKFVKSFPHHLFRSVTIDSSVRQSRTLVIVMGSLRGGEATWGSMYKNLLEVNKADLALVVGARTEENKTSSLYTKAKYVYEYQEYDDWADAVDLINGTSWRVELLNFTNSKLGLFGGVNGFRGSGAIIFMSRWFVAKAFKQFKWEEKYDRFVLTRSDYFYACEHDLTLLDPTKIWIPDGEDYGGITDRHLICGKELFLRAIDIYPTIVQHPTKFVDNSWKRLNPEKLIKQRWQEENLWRSVRRFRRVMFTCAVPGDQTRWRPMGEDIVEEGVYLKYQKEYVSSKNYCSKLIGGRPLPFPSD